MMKMLRSSSKSTTGSPIRGQDGILPGCGVVRPSLSWRNARKRMVTTLLVAPFAEGSPPGFAAYPSGEAEQMQIVPPPNLRKDAVLRRQARELPNVLIHKPSNP